MVDVVVVVVEESKNIYYLSPNNLELKKDEEVIFETQNGILFGKVIKEVYQEKSKNLVLPLNKVLRKATAEDNKQNKENKKLVEDALKEARKNSKKLNLNINFIDGHYYFDQSQLVLYFLSETRVDFRELAKKLAAIFKTRIELRQIGIRDKAKKVGGLGPCGLFLCCNTFLTDFNSVSINMAKNQMLALNPAKINGMCGRLLCCLDYENDTYTEIKKDLPNIGLNTETPMGMGKVVGVNIFKGTYQVDLKEKGIVEFSKDDKE